MKTDTLIRNEGMEILAKNLGMVEAERFIMLIQKEPFDYTKWQENLFENMTIEEISKEASEYRKENIWSLSYFLCKWNRNSFLPACLRNQYIQEYISEPLVRFVVESSLALILHSCYSYYSCLFVVESLPSFVRVRSCGSWLISSNLLAKRAEN
jgi:hypothetical protein